MSGSRPGIQKRVLLTVMAQAGVAPESEEATRAVNWVFPGETICVGRSIENTQLAIKADAAMSKRHFEISFDGTTCRLTDLGSANGTMVDGKRVTSAILSEGDEVCAGTTIFMMEILGEDETTDIGAESPKAVKCVEASPTLDSELASASPRHSDAFQDTADFERPRIVTLRLQGESSASENVEVSRLLAWIRAGQSVRIGSSGFRADWKVTGDLGISRQHFQVSFDGRTCVLQSLDPEKRTYVNGEPATFVRLNDGDTITAGSTSFLVQFS